MDNRPTEHRNMLNEVSLRDRKTLEDFDKRIESLKASRLEGIDSFCNQIKAKIKALQDEKHELLRSPRTKEELLSTAKEELRRNREEISLVTLRKHLEECQRKGGGVPLWPSVMSTGLFNERNTWKLCYLVITDELLEKLVSELPDIGLSEEQRAAKVARLDEEIASLTRELEQNFKKI